MLLSSLTFGYGTGTVTRKQGLGRARKTKGEENTSKKSSPKLSPKISWNDMNEDDEETKTDVDLTPFQHLDFMNFEPMHNVSRVVSSV